MAPILTDELAAYLARARPRDCVDLVAGWLERVGATVPWDDLEAGRALAPAARVRALRRWLDARFDRAATPARGDVVLVRAAGLRRDLAAGLIGPTWRVVMAAPDGGLLSVAPTRARVLRAWRPSHA